MSAGRLQAAVAQGIVNEKYKTEACAFRPCLRGADCWFYHSEEERLPLRSCKSQFCKGWQVRAEPVYHTALMWLIFRFAAVSKVVLRVLAT